MSASASRRNFFYAVIRDIKNVVSQSTSSITVGCWLFCFTAHQPVEVIQCRIKSFWFSLDLLYIHQCGSFNAQSIFIPIIGLVGKVFANSPGNQGSIPGLVIPKTF